jgi:hypothetical protein
VNGPRTYTARPHACKSPALHDSSLSALHCLNVGTGSTTTLRLRITPVMIGRLSARIRLTTVVSDRIPRATDRPRSEVGSHSPGLVSVSGRRQSVVVQRRAFYSCRSVVLDRWRIQFCRQRVHFCRRRIRFCRQRLLFRRIRSLPKRRLLRPFTPRRAQEATTSRRIDDR